MKHIVCFHLFNDYSGSPKVLCLVLDRLLKNGYKVDLISSKGGVLDELLHYENLHKHSYSYRFSRNFVVTILRYSIVQLYTYLLAFRWLFHKNVVFYINTLLPVGPALAGRLMGKRVIYHYHENALVKGAFYKILAVAMQKLAHQVICVSRYQSSFLGQHQNVSIIPNAVPLDFILRLIPNQKAAFERKRILMLGSLKLYKSPLEFIELARRLPLYSFELVVNDTQENINRFIEEYDIIVSNNLIIYPRQNDVAPFYNRASVVLNLSNKKKFIETFGLTALEAMSAGLPIIVPTEGGIAEMVENEINGYKIDVQNIEIIQAAIVRMLTDYPHYSSLAENALIYSKRFSESNILTEISKIVEA